MGRYLGIHNNSKSSQSNYKIKRIKYNTRYKQNENHEYVES